MKKFIYKNSVFIAVLILISCGRNTNYKIVDYRETSNGSAFYCVYAPDTDWVYMQKFAIELLKNKRQWSAVAFFNPLEKTPKLKPNFALPGWASDFMIAKYYFDEKENKFVLYKSPNRFRRDMKFEN